MSFLAACCSCWRRGDHPLLPAPVPEAEVLSAQFALGPPAAVARTAVHELHSDGPFCEERDIELVHKAQQTEQLYDEDWSTVVLRDDHPHSKAARERLREALLGDARAQAVTRIYEDELLRPHHSPREKRLRPRRSLQLLRAAERGRQMERLYEQDWTTASTEASSEGEVPCAELFLGSSWLPEAESPGSEVSLSHACSPAIGVEDGPFAASGGGSPHQTRGRGGACIPPAVAEEAPRTDKGRGAWIPPTVAEEEAQNEEWGHEAWSPRLAKEGPPCAELARGGC